jgi:hypothetical protein
VDDRTLRAALVADLIGFSSVAGIALFLGVPLLPAVITGAIAGTLFFFLIWAAGKRSATFHDSAAPVSGDSTAPVSGDSTAPVSGDPTAPPAPSEDDRA